MLHPIPLRRKPKAAAPQTRKAKAATPPAPYRVTAEEWMRMALAHVFARETRIELLHGEILEMTPIGHPHVRLVNKLNMALAVGALPGWQVSVQHGVQLDRYSVPQPDLALLRPRDDDYASTLPQAADAALLIEVSDTSFEYDRGVKLNSYAAANIPEVWIVNVAERQVEVYTKPSRGKYQAQRVATGKQTLRVPDHSSRRVKLAELFPEPPR